MTNICRNNLIIKTLNKESFTTIRSEILKNYHAEIVSEEYDSGALIFRIRFLSQSRFPIEYLHNLTRSLSDPTLAVKAMCLERCGTQITEYRYEEKIWMWQEDQGKTSIAVPDSLDAEKPLQLTTPITENTEVPDVGSTLK